MHIVKKVSMQYIEMFQALDQGIVVIKDEEVNFQNDYFREILRMVDFEAQNENEILDQELFKIFREDPSNT